MPTDAQILDRLADAWHAQCGPDVDGTGHPARHHAPALAVLLPAVRELLTDTSAADADLRLVEAVIGASGGRDWLAGPTADARAARVVITALQACLDARRRGVLATDHDGGDLDRPDDRKDDDHG